MIHVPCILRQIISWSLSNHPINIHHPITLAQLHFAWKRLMALSFGTQRQQLEQRTMAVWPRPCLERPLLRRLEGMAKELSAGQKLGRPFLMPEMSQERRPEPNGGSTSGSIFWLNMAQCSIILWSCVFGKSEKRRLKEMKSEATNSFKVNVNSVLSWHLDRMEAISYTCCKSFLCSSIQVHEVPKKEEPLGHRAAFCGDFMGRGPVTKKARGWTVQTFTL